MVVQEHVERNPESFGETARFLGIVLGDAPNRPGFVLPGLANNLLNKGKGELARRTAHLVEGEHNGAAFQRVRQAMGSTVKTSHCEIRSLGANGKLTHDT